MGVTIRKAGLADLGLLMDWRMRVLAEVFADSRDVDWEALRGRNEDYYHQHLADGSHSALFAIDDTGAIVGCGGICYQAEMPSPDNPSGTCGYLMNVFATPEARGRGVGHAIVRALIGDARVRGTGKVYLESSEMARRLYQGMGFAPMRDYYKL